MRWAGVALALGVAAALPAQNARAPTLNVLGAVERGAWTVREVGNPRAPRLCLPDVADLLQVQHPRGAGCSRFVIANEAKSATVHYTCPGAGHGRTTLTADTPRVIRVETQGIASNAPFDVRYEARRAPSCSRR